MLLGLEGDLGQAEVVLRARPSPGTVLETHLTLSLVSDLHCGLTLPLSQEPWARQRRRDERQESCPCSVGPLDGFLPLREPQLPVRNKEPESVTSECPSACHQWTLCVTLTRMLGIPGVGAG